MSEVIEITTIECVAIQIKNLGVFSLPRPKRHHHILEDLHKKGISFNHQDMVQGFLTSEEDFVNREEACRIAIKSGQIIKKTHPLDRLFSEDVW